MATEEELPEAAEAAAAPAPAGGGGEDDAEMPDAAVPSGSHSDSSDSDSDDEVAAAAAELRIQALEKTLQEQPLDYETHVQVPFALPSALPPLCLPRRARVFEWVSPLLLVRAFAGSFTRVGVMAFSYILLVSLTGTLGC